MRRNGMGVTTLAAVNGRGAYKRRPKANAKAASKKPAARKKPSVRQSFSRLTPNARRAAARKAVRGTAKRTTKTKTPTRSKNMAAAARRRKTSTARRTTTRRRTSTARRMTPNRRRRTTAKRRTTKRRSYKRNGFTSASAKRAARKRWRGSAPAAGKGARGVKLKSGSVYYKGKKSKRVKARKLPKSRTGIYLTNKRSRAAKKAWRTRKARMYAANRSSGRRKPTVRRTKGWTVRRRVSAGRGSAGTKLRSGTIYYTQAKKPKSLRGVKRARKLPKGKRGRSTTYYLTNRRKRKSAKRVAAGRKAAATRKRNLAKRRARRTTGRRRASYRKNGSRRSYRRNAERPRLAGQRTIQQRYIRSRGRYLRKNGRRRTRRSYRKNGMAMFKDVMKTGLFVGSGILAHRLATNALSKYVVQKYILKPAAAAGLDIRAAEPFITGAVVFGVGALAATKLLSPARGREVAAGMFGSLLLQGVGFVLGLVDPSSKFAGMLSGSPSRAAAIGGFGAFVQHGAPQESIMPFYTPTGAGTGFQQAVAGGRGVGEYFEANPFGEYFASGIEGVGSYEEAGELAMQAAAGFGVIDDGIRPDSDLDQLLMLQSAQAGYGGLGEYFSANQQGQLQTIPSGSTWIPGETDGALWAGTKGANDSRRTSQEAAGTLLSASGNGIF